MEPLFFLKSRTSKKANLPPLTLPVCQTDHRPLLLLRQRQNEVGNRPYSASQVQAAAHVSEEIPHSSLPLHRLLLVWRFPHHN